MTPRITPYRVKWDPEAHCYRIFQKCGQGYGHHAVLEWLRFATPEAAYSYVEIHGLPRLFRRQRVRSYVRAVAA